MHTNPKSNARIRCVGFTVLELAVVLAVVGIFLAAFVPAFAKNIQTSKVAEATFLLNELAQKTAAYYAAEHQDKNGLTLRHCLPSAAGPTPSLPSHTPVAVNFALDEASKNTWSALKFQPDQPLRFRYSVIPTQAGCDLPTKTTRVLLRAEGDLDHDKHYSVFERISIVNAQHELTPYGVLWTRDSWE